MRALPESMKTYSLLLILYGFGLASWSATESVAASLGTP